MKRSAKQALAFAPDWDLMDGHRGNLAQRVSPRRAGFWRPSLGINGFPAHGQLTVLRTHMMRIGTLETRFTAQAVTARVHRIGCPDCP